MTRTVSERGGTRKVDSLQETPDHREIEEVHRNVIIFVSDGLHVKNGRCDGANAPGPMTAKPHRPHPNSSVARLHTKMCAFLN